MNSNHHNDYEIIDSNTSPYPSNKNNEYSRYPYTHNPNQPMQNANYKNWINLCQENTQYGQNPETFNDTQTAVVTSLAIVGTILAIPFPVTGAGITILGTLLPFVWPSSADTSQGIWISFINSTEVLIDKTINSQTKTNAVRELQGLQSNVQHYQNLLQSWLKSKNNVSFQTAVSQAFTAAHSHFLRSMNYFKGVQNQEENILLLPIYAHAANLHLLLLRDASIYGKEWGFSPQEINIFYNNQTSLTNEYIEHCTQSYNTGLSIVKTHYLRKFDWNNFNSFRREMTIKVLDIIALFSNYDTHKYPVTINNTLLPKTELTREIYTKANSGDTPPKDGLDQVEQALTRTPHLFTWLNQLILFASKNDYSTFSLTANQNCVIKTNERICSTEKIYGEKRTNDTINQINLDRFNIDKITMFSPNNIRTLVNALHFYQGTITQAIYNPGNEISSQPILTFEIPPVTRNNKTFNHILSYMTTAVDNSIATDPKTSGSRQIAFAWTHSSVDSKNTIQEKVITAIPAIKAQFFKYPNIVKNPGHLGGDLISFKTPNSVNEKPLLNLQCQVSNFTLSNPQNYAIRIRYAANQRIGVNVNISGRPSRSFTTSDTMSSSINQGQFLYRQFGYVDVFTRTNPISLSSNSLITIDIEPSSPLTQNTIFAIDRIEFIPLNHFQTFENEQQTIETIQNQTNDLFIDYTKNTLKTEVTDYQIDQQYLQGMYLYSCSISLRNFQQVFAKTSVLLKLKL
uniref:Crystaline entomocidal protoxin n=1 Tax=Bacillus thuringiensis TaxID=1428 RepID=G0WLG5_BACTU|nr:84 kDa crystal toxin protein [Bacillus thuringiensis]